jgi:hypothetical protein
MKTDFTKSSWKAEPSANDVDWLVQDEDHNSILITLEYGLAGEYQDYEKAEVHAKLCAAAPDMLVALMSVWEYLKAIKVDYPMVERAIQKAEL